MAIGRTTSHAPIPAETEAICRQVIDAIIAVHRELGPGLLESVYERCMIYELTSRGLDVRRQVILPILYKGQPIDDGLRLDLVVANCVIVEIKSVDELHPVVRSQCITYLKLSGLRVCLLINFNARLAVDGLERIVL